ncbi:uncharacterized protein BJ171DRAFT_636488 [Polychytrium aggregatum]|uniref:uncharacterized protein n=1 Tax=Polychytrium aggregatum TaxID=110093 RepID=UPI0022FE4FCB|nr:uncharacterized protein BJ171DRAFT_636488 [Polychytrium aggregatum]KAI9208004.1 hypothetical protein BJ171DRAFT_636488 [Polychytrium aggregatum]
MSREQPLRRTCPPLVQERLDQAANLRLLVVQELGPMAFILREAEAEKKYKVGLGSCQTCTCADFVSEQELCVHILWVMIKVFHVPKDSEAIYQRSLVEREISQVLRGRKSYHSNTPPSVAAAKTQPARPENDDAISRREISEGDVCPICQEEFDDTAPSQITYCKTSCGNNVHIKCMKIMAEHQAKAMGVDVVKCPLCRNNFGTIDHLKGEYEAAFKVRRREKVERETRHLGCTCRGCGLLPIVGNCHKCQNCKEYYLCQKCFTGGSHSEHVFMVRSKRQEQWKPASRMVASSLPPQLIDQLQRRELGHNDYDLLLQLDGRVEQGHVPIQIVNSFPTKTVKSTDLPGLKDAKCEICYDKWRRGDLKRILPCGCDFHRPCIDRWLLQTKPNCPRCHRPAYSSISNQGEADAIMLDLPVYRPNYYDIEPPPSEKPVKPKKSRQAHEPQPPPVQENMICVIGNSQHHLAPAAEQSQRASTDETKAQSFRTGRPTDRRSHKTKPKLKPKRSPQTAQIPQQERRPNCPGSDLLLPDIIVKTIVPTRSHPTSSEKRLVGASNRPRPTVPETAADLPSGSHQPHTTSRALLSLPSLSVDQFVGQLVRLDPDAKGQARQPESDAGPRAKNWATMAVAAHPKRNETSFY